MYNLRLVNPIYAGPERFIHNDRPCAIAYVLTGVETKSSVEQ